MAATFICGLDPHLAEKIKRAGARRTYPARSYIFYEGDPSTGVLVVESGLLRIDRTTTNGRIVLFDLASKGSLIGDLGVIDGEPRSATLSSVTKSVVTSVPAEAFRALLDEDRRIQAAVLSRLARRLRELSSQFMETSTMDAPARVALRLLRLVEIEQSLGRAQVGPSGEIDLRLPVSQEELGQWAGLSREGAVKGLSTLRSIGLIKTGRKRVEITNLAELRAWL